MKKTTFIAIIGMLFALHLSAQHGLYYCLIPQSPDVGYSLVDYPTCADTVSCGTYGVRNLDWVLDSVLHPNPATWPTSSPVTKFTITFFATDQNGNAYAGQPFTLPTKLTFDGREYYQNVTYGDSATATLVSMVDILPPWQNQKMVNLKTVLASLPSDVYRIRARINTYSTVYEVASGQGWWIYNMDALDAVCTMPNEYFTPGTDSIDVELDNVEIMNYAPDTAMQPALVTKFTISATTTFDGLTKPFFGPFCLTRSGGDTIPVWEISIDSAAGTVDIIVDIQHSTDHLEFIPVNESRTISIVTRALPLEGTTITTNVRAEARVYGPNWKANDIPTTPPPTFTPGRTITFGTEPTSVTQTDAGAFDIYPNPTTDAVFIKASNLLRVELYSASGKMISSTSAQGDTPTQLHIGAWPNGLYFVKVTDTAEHVTVKKILKN